MGSGKSNLRKAFALHSKRKELEIIRTKRIQAEENLTNLKRQIKLQEQNADRDRAMALKKLEEIKIMQQNINASVEQTVKAHEDFGFPAADLRKNK